MYVGVVPVENRSRRFIILMTSSLQCKPRVSCDRLHSKDSGVLFTAWQPTGKST